MIVCYPLSWSDYTELICISLLLYRIMKWLAQDKHSPLLTYAYIYAGIASIAYIFNLSIILMLLYAFTPLFCIVIVMLHQHSLQKNMITHKHITYKQAIESNWLEIILASALTHINATKSVTVVIEHTDDLSPFLITLYALKTPITKELMDIFINEHIYNGTSMIWVQSSGDFMYHHATWRHHHTEFDADLQQELSLIYTAKTDSIVCIIHQQSRTCSLIVRGNTIAQIPTYQASQLIRKHINTNDISPYLKKASHEHTTHNNLL